ARAGEYVEEGGQGDHNAAPCVERSYIAKETLGDIFDYLATMPASAQQLFQMRFVSALSYNEIALLMDITEASARQKVRKLRQKLQAWMEN
ncbi:MAG: sigma-70 family RNA polymerase sigma factor, partial [Rhodobacteraceae bacterium]|nr:sigma-70 family RNA polymerase sigma factor [Paracoccaceae bacterium]